jgi:hypothetical protein
LPAALIAVLLSVLAVPGQDARAEFGDPTILLGDSSPNVRAKDYTPEQRQQVADLEKALLKEIRPIEEQLRAIRGQIAGLLVSSAPVNAAQLAPLAKQAAALQAQWMTLAVAEQMQVRAIATPAQLADAAQRNQALQTLQAQRNVLMPSKLVIGPAVNDLYDDDLGFTRGIALTAEQQAQADALIRAGGEQTHETVQSLDAVRAQADAQLNGTGSATYAQIAQLQQQAVRLIARQDADRLNLAVQVRSILTPDQLAQAQALHDQLASLHEQEAALRAQEKTLRDQAKSGG